MVKLLNCDKRDSIIAITFNYSILLQLSYSERGCPCLYNFLYLIKSAVQCSVHPQGLDIPSSNSKMLIANKFYICIMVVGKMWVREVKDR